MKKFFLLYFSLFTFVYSSFQLNFNFSKYFLFGFIIFQFVISLGTFFMDDSDLKEIYNHVKNVPLILILSFDLIFIALLFYFEQTMFGCLWFVQSFLINNTYIKAEKLFNKHKGNI
jgi:hypothetical protein